MSGDNTDDDIYKRYKHQDDPPDWLSDDLEENYYIVNRYDRCPAWFTGFGKYLPHHNDKKDDQSNVYNPNNCPYHWIELHHG